MKLRIKEEYIEYSLGGSKMRAIRLKDIPVSQYNRYYQKFPGFFEVVDDEPSKLTVIEDEEPKKTTKRNDKNNKRNKSIGLSDTDGESDPK